jgi:DNA-binding CsgD family transcriptional regulator
MTQMLGTTISLDDGSIRVPCPTVWARITRDAVEGLGTPSFGNGVLASLNQAVPACEWSFYVLRKGGTPALHTAGCLGLEDRTRDSWARYSDALHEQDTGFSRLWHHAAPSSWWSVHCPAQDLSERHRAELYRPQQLKERLSVVQRRGDELWSLNLYRHEGQAGFGEADLTWLHALSGPLFACVDKHAQWGRPHDPWRTLAADLTVRERQVCDRLLQGWTHDGIAADLGITARTVKTYRDRAFVRLGIHHRHQLFALVGQCSGAGGFPGA